MEFRLYSIKLTTPASQPDKLVRDETGKIRLWDNCGPDIKSLCRMLVANGLNAKIVEVELSWTEMEK